MIKSSDELDDAILSVCTPRFQKVARVIVTSLEASGIPVSAQGGDDAERAALRIQELIQAGRVEVLGNAKQWRHSEVRLPQQPAWIDIDHRDDYTILRLCSFDNINRLPIAVIVELGNILESLGPLLSPLIITGNDKFFSVGADLNEMAAHDSVSGYRFSRLGQRVMDQLDCFPALTIAAISGNCFGGAIDMALACDMRICAPNATFGHRGAALGLLTGWGGTQRLPRLVGKARALQMFCAAEKINAAEALRIGLINEIAENPVRAATAMANLKWQMPKLEH